MAPSYPAITYWFRRFKSGDFSVEDEERPGRPEKFDDQDLQALLDKDPTQTKTQLAQALGVVQSIVSRRLKKMGKIRERSQIKTNQLHSD